MSFPTGIRIPAKLISRRKKNIMKRILTACCVAALCLAVMCTAFADEASFVPQGQYCVFTEDGLCGVQTLAGETVIPPRFHGIQPIRGDLCIVETRDEARTAAGLWRLSTAEELLPCEYWELIITDTMVIVSDKRDAADDGYYLSQLYDPDRKTFIVTEEDPSDGVWPLADGKYFLLIDDENGTDFLITPNGTPLLDSPVTSVTATSFSGDFVAVYNIWDKREGLGQDGVRYLNTATGEWLDGFWWFGYTFADGFAAVWTRDWKWYVIDQRGAALTPAYDWIANEDDDPDCYGMGLFSVKQGDNWYIIRVNAETPPETLLGPVQCAYEPSYLGKGVYALPVQEGTLVFSGVSRQERLLENTHVCGWFTLDSTMIRQDDRYGFLFDDLTVIEPAFDKCLSFSGDFSFVKTDGLWHPIDRAGQVDFTISYSEVILSRRSGCFFAKYDDTRFLCLNKELEPISYAASLPQDAY